MNKTLHKKLTGKYLYNQAPAMAFEHGADAHGGMQLNLLKEAAKDLLQPRPEAVAKLLKMAREL
jgi:hypothetical protein